jgi:hypothetical protein
MQCITASKKSRNQHFLGSKSLYTILYANLIRSSFFFLRLTTKCSLILVYIKCNKMYTFKATKNIFFVKNSPHYVSSIWQNHKIISPHIQYIKLCLHKSFRHNIVQHIYIYTIYKLYLTLLIYDCISFTRTLMERERERKRETDRERVCVFLERIEN